MALQKKHLLLGAALLAAGTLGANAQLQYPVTPAPGAPPSWSYPAGPVPTPPPSWYYNPYTSGLGPCPQRLPGDPPCSETMEPSYGQPSFWAR